MSNSSVQKALISVVVFAAIIGYKVYNRMPRYHEEIHEQFEVAPNEIVQFSFAPFEEVKTKLEVDTKHPGEVLIFVVDDPNLEKFDAALEIDDFEFQDVKFAMRSTVPIGIFSREMTMAAKNYNVLVVNVDEAEPVNVTLTVSSYQ